MTSSVAQIQSSIELLTSVQSVFLSRVLSLALKYGYISQTSASYSSPLSHTAHWTSSPLSSFPSSELRLLIFALRSSYSGRARVPKSRKKIITATSNQATKLCGSVGDYYTVYSKPVGIGVKPWLWENVLFGLVETRCRLPSME